MTTGRINQVAFAHRTQTKVLTPPPHSGAVLGILLSFASLRQHKPDFNSETLTKSSLALLLRLNHTQKTPITCPSTKVSAVMESSFQVFPFMGQFRSDSRETSHTNPQSDPQMKVQPQICTVCSLSCTVLLRFRQGLTRKLVIP